MKRTIIAVVVAVALTATVTAAAATSGNTVKACSNIKTRVLALRSGPSCPSGSRALDWSITGPQGKQGIQGKRGIQGKQGAPGSGLAWAWVLSDGHVEASTPNVTSVAKNVGGVQGAYCVNLSIATANVATVSISDVSWGQAARLVRLAFLQPQKSLDSMTPLPVAVMALPCRLWRHIRAACPTATHPSAAQSVV